MNEPTQATAAAQAETAKTTREPGGQFAKGNKGGPGNPFARQVAALRKAILDNLTSEDIKAIVNKLKEMAIAGDLAAAKLLFAYAIGKPQPAVEPDHLDVEEWEKLKATAFLMKELPRAMGPGLDLPLTVARGVRPGMTAGMTGLLGQCLAQPHRAPELVSAMFPPADEDGGYPSPNGCNRPRSPSPNTAMTEHNTTKDTDVVPGRLKAIFLRAEDNARLAKEHSVGGRGHVFANVVHERKDPILPDQAS